MLLGATAHAQPQIEDLSLRSFINTQFDSDHMRLVTWSAPQHIMYSRQLIDPTTAIQNASGFTLTESEARELGETIGADQIVTAEIVILAQQERESYELRLVEIGEQALDHTLWDYTPPYDSTDSDVERARLFDELEREGELHNRRFIDSVRAMLSDEQAAQLDVLLHNGVLDRSLESGANTQLEHCRPDTIASAVGSAFSTRDEVISILDGYSAALRPLIASRNRSAERAEKLLIDRLAMLDAGKRERASSIWDTASDAALDSYGASVRIGRLHVQTIEQLYAVASQDEQAIILEHVSSSLGALRSAQLHDTRGRRTRQFSRSIRTLRAQTDTQTVLTQAQSLEIDRLERELWEAVKPHITALNVHSAWSEARRREFTVRTPRCRLMITYMREHMPERQGTHRSAWQSHSQSIQRAEQAAIEELRTLLTQEQEALLAWR